MLTQDFIERAKRIHGDKYDYSKVDYKNTKTKVTIICPIHGEFYQRPNNHLNGQGCPHCSVTHKLTKEIFVKKASEIHEAKYDYSKVNYVNNKTKICIICPEHGEFEQKPNDHLMGHGCPKCGGTKKYTTDEFIKRARKVHGDKYDYSKVEYKTMHTKIIITCKKHGDFSQFPNDHLKGCGCPKCNQSKLEMAIEERLNELGVEYTPHAHFGWLGRQEIDFYMPEYNIGIECQGRQHFMQVDLFEPLDIIQKRDRLKKKLCEEHGIRIIYYSNLGIDYPYQVFEDKEELLKEIINEQS